VDKQVEYLHRTVNAILDTHCLVNRFRVRRDKPAWVTPLIQKLIRARDRAFKKGCKTWHTFKHLIRKLIRKAKAVFVSTKLNSAHSAKKWWATIKQLENNSNTSTDNHLYTIDDKCMPAKTLCDELKSFYVKAGGDYMQHLAK
jgi:hypothetical protein